MPQPNEPNTAAYDLWLFAANHAEIEWRVFVEDGQVCAQNTDEPIEQQPTHLTFNLPARDSLFLQGGRLIYCPVDDGWLGFQFFLFLIYLWDLLNSNPLFITLTILFLSS